MTESEFASRNFFVRCPVWAIAKAIDNDTECLAMFVGNPHLGRFLPVFLSQRVAEEFAEETPGFRVVQADSVDDLSTLISLFRKEITNAAVYLKKGKARFYRIDDLLEELRSKASN